MKSLYIKLLLLLIGAVACARGSAQNLRLENADGVFSLEEVLLKDPGVRTFSIKIPMHEGNPVRGYIGIPKDATPGTHPIYMFAHGAGRITRIWTRASSERERIRFIEDYLR